MKYKLLLVSLICSINCFSQNPDSRLFQTWYLSLVQSNDMAETYLVPAIVPAITPTLVISNDLTFTGNGACNSFFGTFVNVSENLLETDQMSITLLLCNYQSHMSLESSYFNFMQSAAFYQIAPVGQGLVLTMGSPLMGQAVFQNFPLNTIDFDLEKIAVYPNPGKSRIFINSNQIPISKIQVINSVGQNVKTVNADFETLDIADLPSGIYILKIDAEHGTINKKIVKE